MVALFDHRYGVWESGHHPFECASSPSEDLDIGVEVLPVAGDPKGEGWVAEVIRARADGVDDVSL